MPYMQRRPIIEESDYVVDEGVRPYRSPFSNSGSLLVFFLLILLAGWVLFGNNRNPRDFGLNWGNGSDQVAIIGTPDADIRVEATPRVVYRERAATVIDPPVRRTVVTPTPRPVTRETVRPATPRGKDPDVVGYSWISSPRVNMRSGPGTQYELVSVLNQNQMVAILNKFELDDVGDSWSKISVESKGFIQEGWINRSYLSY
jgi:Bacterial SH3 domain